VILVVGEILFDIFENEKQLGGAPFNFAYHLKSLGFPVRYISRIGNDAHGKEILQRLRRHDFKVDDIQIDDDHATGTVVVQLDSSGNPGFHITPNAAYDYIRFSPEIHASLIDAATVFYFGTLAQRTEAGFKNIQKMLSLKRPDTTGFYDINLRPDCYSERAILASLAHTDVLKLNTQELNECRGLFRFSKDKDAFIHFLMDTYGLKIMTLTRGDKGSDLYTKTGCFRRKTKPASAVVDTVGAGDAFAAMLTVGMLKGWRLENMLTRASAFASRICQIRGAVPESLEFYEPVKEWMKEGE
jgi:fructokinase